MLIRSTIFSRLNYMSNQTSEVTNDLNTLTQQIATGKRLNRMSEEPWSVTQIHQLKEELSLQNHFQMACDRSMGLLNAAEDALDLINGVISRTREIAIQMSTDTFNAEQIDDAIDEVTNLKERVRNLINSEFNGRYVFGGTGYDQEPFDSAYAYQGTNVEVSMDVSETASVDVGFDGSVIFLDNNNRDIFAQFDDLIDGLTNNDDALINGAMETFDQTQDNMGEFRTRVGTEMNIANDMDELATSISIRLTEGLSNIEDVDIAEALTKFTLFQTQYEINLQLTSKTRSMTLFERM